MKKILLITCCIFYCCAVMAQTTDTTFKKQWALIDSLIVQKNLPKSALAKVNDIYNEAKRRNLSAQLIKSLLYRMSLESRVTEEDINKNIASLQNEIDAAKNIPQKSILEILLAQTYSDYLNNTSWQIAQRSKTINYKKEDVATWNLDDFNSAVETLYRKALQPAAVLQQTPLQPYNAIIIKGNTEKLRPTLYDLLAHIVLDYFKSDNVYLTKPTYAFEIKEEAALSNADNFINHHFSSKDSASYLLKALQLFQELMRFHMNGKDPSAFIDVNLERVDWVNNKAIIDDKENLYTQALKDITTHYPDEVAAEQAWYLQAKLFADKAAGYQPFGDSSHRFDYVTAKDIIKKRLTAQPAPGEGNSNMQQLLKQIESKDLNTQVENVNIPNQPFRMYVQYRNAMNLYGRIIRLNDIKDLPENIYEENFWKSIASYKAYKTFTQTLPQTNDYQQHAAEIKNDALPVGRYVILASTGSGFSAAEDKLILQFFDVSNISYIKNGSDYFVLNRETGKRLPGVKVKVEVQVYNGQTQRNNNKEIATKTPDEHGFFSLSDIKGRNNNIRLRFFSKTDTLELENDEYYYPRNLNVEDDNKDSDTYEKDNAKVYFFTDRSIYRPGQTVFFKGIVITKDKKTKQPKLMHYEDSIEVNMSDVNDNTVDSLELKLNEYGSFSGKFKIPVNVLTGAFSIETIDFGGRASFNVEEYKRPKFYVEFDTLKSTYRLNDTIKITGYAKAYAGNNIDGAQVKFNVQRNTRYIYDWMFWYRPRLRSQPQQIAEGVITTDANGKFEISFIAKPDLGVDKTTEPVFDFSVEASVTDINGETREQTTSISVGYKSLMLQLNIPEMVDVSAFKSIDVTTQNLSGQNIPANVHINIYPLQSPDKLIRKRYWQQPDQYVMSKKEFEKYFPYDEYEEETNYKTWQRKDAVVNDTLNTASTSNFKLQASSLSQGWYAVEAITHDKDGQEVKEIKYVQLYDKQSASLPSPQYEWSNIILNTVQPGDTAKMLIGTSAKDVYVIQNTQRQTGIEENDKDTYNYFSLDHNKKQIEFTVTAADHGAGLYYAFVMHNRYYTGGMNVVVQDDSKNLQVSYTTYRDKAEPGSNEKWTVKISGSKGEKVAAELLSGMYDASLDQFRPHSWETPNDLWPNYYTNNGWQGSSCFAASSSTANQHYEEGNYFAKIYDVLATSAENFWNGIIEYRHNRNLAPMALEDKGSGLSIQGNNGRLNEVVIPAGRIVVRGNRSLSGIGDFNGDENASDSISFNMVSNRADLPSDQNKGAIQIRKNFNETAFFFPQLHADTAGNYSFSFTIPEALTQWKWMSFAHTKDLAFGYHQTMITTQKKLMVQPNAPRFMREGDQMEFSTKISNLSDSAMTGQVSLELVDATTNQIVDGLFQNAIRDQNFTAAAGQSTAVKFSISIPYNFNKPLTWRVVAKTKLTSPGGEGRGGEASDGEENTLPILTNRMLVTESLPLYMRGDTTKHFTFEKLLKNQSPTLSTQSLTVEYTSNPVWYAVQSLPYLMEFPYECSEQTFNRFYANALASYIANNHPKIKAVFDKWRSDTLSPGEGRGEVFASNLQKNEELKQVLLEETPWVIDAQNEAQQKKNIALLFDVIKMKDGLQFALEKLKQLQMPSGGFAWFKGGNEDRYITQYILTGIGRLQAIQAIPTESSDALHDMVAKGLLYLDAEVNNDYNNLKKYKVDLTKNNLSQTQIQYLYMRSYFIDVAKQNKTAYNYYYQQQMKFWQQQTNYMKAMIGITLYRTTQQQFVNNNILPSIIENAVEDADAGMYWKDAQAGYYWYQAPIEQQALMIEFINEAMQGQKNNSLMQKIGDMQTWLLRNKQTTNWKTTKATADACFALLLRGNDNLSVERNVEIRLGSDLLLTSSKGGETEAGTGYFKEKINGDDVKPTMGNISVTTTSNLQPLTNSSTPSWGAVYWQYFEDLDKITPASTPLSLHKKLFVEKNTDAGKILTPVNDNDELHIGDKVVVRIELKCDRDMEYVHLKDMRAAAMEPVNVLSEYKWQDGLGYYEATKDASTNFFISYLQKGTYVFEYPLYITHAGTFSVGIANIQCMYAPEFASHSEGIKIKVEAPKPPSPKGE